MQAVPNIQTILNDPDWGDECPVCGDPFTTKKSGIIWPQSYVIRDAFAWDKVCQAPTPEPIEEFIDERDIDNEFPAVSMAYVHTVSDTC